MFDLRSSHISERYSTPEKRRELRRTHPDDDDLRSLGSLTRHKLIPKIDSEVDRLNRQHDNEIRALRADFEMMRNEQQRLRDEVGSVRS